MCYAGCFVNGLEVKMRNFLKFMSVTVKNRRGMFYILALKNVFVILKYESESTI